MRMIRQITTYQRENDEVVITPQLPLENTAYIESTGDENGADGGNGPAGDQHGWAFVLSRPLGVLGGAFRR